MSINFLAILVSAVVSMIIGSIWYGPLFGKMYMQEMGMIQWSDEQKKAMRSKMTVSYSMQFVASLVTFYVLAYFMVGFGQMTVSGGLMMAGIVWIGFVVPLKLGEALWGGKMKLFWLAIFANLITLLSVGAIIVALK